MFELLGKMFFAALGLLSGFSALLFALFTIMAAAMLIHSWLDREFSIKDRCWITLMMALVITWGGWLTMMAATYAGKWLA